MAIAYSDFMTILRGIIGDDISGTTSSDGSTDKDTFIDATMKKYPDGWFGDPTRRPEWWVYQDEELDA